MNRSEAEAILALWIEVDVALEIGAARRLVRPRAHLHLAAERALERVFQAAIKLDRDLINSYFGAVGFAQLRGMRNRLAHNYLNVDEAFIFEAIDIDLPQVRARLYGDCQAATAVLAAAQQFDDEAEWLFTHHSHT